MREMLERLLQSAEVPNPERAEQLWADYRAGGPGAGNAFATLLAWYGNVIYRRIWGFVRSDAAEDVFQDVLTRLHKARKNLATFDHALRWLRTVAVAASLNAHRGERRRRARDERAARPEAEPAAERADEMQEAIRVGLAELPEDLREVVALHFFEGLMKRDAAAVLGIDRDTVAKRLLEALGRLRQLVPVPAVAGAALLETKLAAGPPPLPPTRMATLAAAARPAVVAGWLWSSKAKVVAAVLVVGMTAVASGYYLTRSPDMPVKSPRPTVRLGVEPLEARTVPTSGLLSALGVGNTTGVSQGIDVATDAAGNRYVTGHFSGTTDFDPARTHPGNADVLTARGTQDIFVAKYAADDTLVWARRMGGAGGNTTELDRGQAVSVDAAGNVYAAGYFVGSADFSLTINLTSAGGQDAFVVKINPAGTVLWAKTWGGTGSDQAHGVGTDAAGNVYVGGYESSGHAVRKFSPTGGAVWTKRVETRAQYMPSGMVVDSAGNTYLTGQFVGRVDFDPAAPAGKKRNEYWIDTGPKAGGFVLKLNDSGNFAWASAFKVQPLGVPDENLQLGALALDGEGGVVVSGTYTGQVDFDPGAGITTLPAQKGSFIARLNPAGGLAWVRGLENDAEAGNSITVYGLAVDAAGDVYATGTYRGTVDFNPGDGTDIRTSPGSHNAFALKLTSAGDFAWAKTFDGYRGTGQSISVDSAGAVHLTGGFVGTVDFDPDPTSTHNLTTPGSFASIFVVKLSQN